MLTHRTRFLALLVLVFSAFSSDTATGYSALYVVGDSLSDTGNAYLALGGTTTTAPYSDLVPAAPYDFAGGRFANGPVWVEGLAAGLGTPLSPSLLGGSSFAFGGARTGPLNGAPANAIPTLVQQAALAAASPLPDDALYVVWGGGNDVRDASLFAAAGDINAAVSVINDAVSNVETTIETLKAAGAQNFLVPNLPDLGLTPVAQLMGPAAAAGANLLSTSFNDALAIMLNGLSGADIQLLDTFTFVNDIFADPVSWGFANLTDPCALANGGLGCADPDGYFFWDGIHPGAAAHALLGDLAVDTVAPAAPVPIPAPIVLMMSGIAGLSMLATRRRRETA